MDPSIIIFLFLAFPSNQTCCNGLIIYIHLLKQKTHVSYFFLFFAATRTKTVDMAMETLHSDVSFLVKGCHNNGDVSNGSYFVCPISNPNFLPKQKLVSPEHLSNRHSYFPSICMGCCFSTISGVLLFFGSNPFIIEPRTSFNLFRKQS